LPYFGLEFPWQVMWFAPDVITLVNVQNSNAPVAVFMRQIVDVPGWGNPVAIWI
jgi:hypothetical protein